MENFFSNAMEFTLFKKALKSTDKEPVMLNLSSTDSSLQTNKEPAKVAYNSTRKNMSEKFEPSPFGKYFGARKSKNTAVDMNDFSSWKNKNYRKIEEEANLEEKEENTKPFSLSEYLKNKSSQKFNELDQAKTDLKKPITQLSSEDPDYQKFSLDSYMHKLEENIISKNKFEKNDDLLEPLSRDENVMPTTNQDEDFARSNIDLDEDAFDDIGPGEKFSLDRSELDEVKKRLDRIERESANIKEKSNQGVITGDEFKESSDEDNSINKIFTDPLKEMDIIDEGEEENPETAPSQSGESGEASDAGEKRYYEVNMNEDQPQRKKKFSTAQPTQQEEDELPEDTEIFTSDDLIDDTEDGNDDLIDEEDESGKEVDFDEDENEETDEEDISETDEDVPDLLGETEEETESGSGKATKKKAKKQSRTYTGNEGDEEETYDPYDEDDYFDGYDTASQPEKKKAKARRNDNFDDEENPYEDIETSSDEDIDQSDNVGENKAKTRGTEKVSKPQQRSTIEPVAETEAVAKTQQTGTPETEAETEIVAETQKSGTPETDADTEIVAKTQQKSAAEEELETKIAELTEKSKKADEEANEKLRRVEEEKERDYKEYQERLRGMEESYNKKYEEIRERMLLDRLSNERKLDEFHSKLRIRESEIREQQLKPAVNMKQISMLLSKELKSNHNISNLESDNKLLQITNKLKKEEEKQSKSEDTSFKSQSSTKKSSSSKKSSNSDLNLDASAAAPKRRRRRGKSRRRIDSDIIGTIDFD